MKKSIIIPLIVVVVASVLFSLKRTSTHKESHQQDTSTTSTGIQAIQPNQPQQQAVTTASQVTAVEDNQKEETQRAHLDEYTSIAKEHRLSLLTMVDYLHRYASRETSRESLMSELTQQNLKPQNRKDENPYTGSLNIVRTQNTLPGTRYFHAQFFSNEDGSEFLQHMSFEFAPGEQSLAAVVRALSHGQENLEMTQDKENFKSWRTQDGYIIWAKVLDASDLDSSDPFNAYKPSDAGIIRVAKELDIHDHAPAFHAEQGSPDQTQE